MRAAVKRVSSKRAHRNLREHERSVAHSQKSAHQSVAFSCDFGVNPKQGKLRVQPIQREEEKALCQGTHVFGEVSFWLKIFTTRPWNCETSRRRTQRFRRPYGMKRDSLRTTESKVTTPSEFRRSRDANGNLR